MVSRHSGTCEGFVNALGAGLIRIKNDLEKLWNGLTGDGFNTNDELKQMEEGKKQAIAAALGEWDKMKTEDMSQDILSNFNADSREVTDAKIQAMRDAKLDTTQIEKQVAVLRQQDAAYKAQLKADSLAQQSAGKDTQRQYIAQFGAVYSNSLGNQTPKSSSFLDNLLGNLYADEGKGNYVRYNVGGDYMEFEGIGEGGSAGYAQALNNPLASEKILNGKAYNTYTTNGTAGSLSGCYTGNYPAFNPTQYDVDYENSPIQSFGKDLFFGGIVNGFKSWGNLFSDVTNTPIAAADELTDMGCNAVGVNRQDFDAIALQTPMFVGDDMLAMGSLGLKMYVNEIKGVNQTAKIVNQVNKLEDLTILENTNVGKASFGDKLKNIFSDPSVAARNAQGKGLYPGVDNWENGFLKKGDTVWAGNTFTDNFGNFFTDARTMDLSGADAQKVFEGLQVTNGNFSLYRPGMTLYEVTSSVKVGKAKCLNNPGYGAGGFTEFYLENPEKFLKPVSSKQLKNRIPKY